MGLCPLLPNPDWVDYVMEQSNLVVTKQIRLKNKKINGSPKDIHPDELRLAFEAVRDHQLPPRRWLNKYGDIRQELFAMAETRHLKKDFQEIMEQKQKELDNHTSKYTAQCQHARVTYSDVKYAASINNWY